MEKCPLSASDKMKQEYCCTVVRVGECFPIEGADRIQRTVVGGYDMVVSKSVKEGDVMIYAANETALDGDFLSANNLYGISDYELNEDHVGIKNVIDTAGKDAAKLMCGFFTPQNRVKRLKLRGTFSFGFLFSPGHLVRWKPELMDVDFASLVGMDFDTVCDVLFVKAYVPAVHVRNKQRDVMQRDNHRGKFCRLLPGEFKFHYDTKPLQRNMDAVHPTDSVVITPKVHGTSAIFARIPCRKPRSHYALRTWWNKVADILHLPESLKSRTCDMVMDNICSSRTVIRNAWVNLHNPVCNPTDDIWGRYNQVIGPLVPEHCYVYGEIVGYQPESSVFIQKHYDYGCAAGESKFMPYRIVMIYGNREIDLNVSDVRAWTEVQMQNHPEIRDMLMPIPILYQGTLHSLYPRIPLDDKWHDNVLAALKVDADHFGMELNEPLCRNKVPREGICIRLNDDPVQENFKLKCARFLDRESRCVDAGEVDIEMQETGY